MAYKYFTEEEKAYIRENCGRKTVKRIAIDLGRKVGSTRGLIKKMIKRGEINDYLRVEKRYLWDDEMEQYLADNYGKKASSEIADELGIDVSQISTKIWLLRERGMIPRWDGESGWSEREDEIIRQGVEVKTMAEVAEELGRNVIDVRNRVIVLRKKGALEGYFKRG